MDISAAEPTTATDLPKVEVGADDAAATATPIDTDALREAVIKELKTCYDPEIPVDIYELGLIYVVDVQEDGKVHVKMTLTSPSCPAAGSLPGEVQSKVRSVEGVTDGRVEVVWEPTWHQGLMTEAARLQLGLF